jgi:hypothetical protein
MNNDIDFPLGLFLWVYCLLSVDGNVMAIIHKFLHHSTSFALCLDREFLFRAVCAAIHIGFLLDDCG